MILAGSPISLINGRFVWFSDGNPALPTSAGDGYFTQGDLLVNLASSPSAPANPPTVYRCTGSGTGATATWQIASQGGSAVKSVSAAYAATQNDDLIVVTGGSAIAVTLPTSASTPIGKSYTVVRNGAGNGTVVVAGTGVIGDAHHTVTFGADESAVTLTNDGTQYQIRSSTGTISTS